MSRPLVGILLDYSTKTKAEGGYANFPWYALRCNYSDAVAKAGGVPVLIPYEDSCLDRYLRLCQGIIIPGCGFDIPPSYYGEEVSVTNIDLAPDTHRIDFELKLIRKLLRTKLPLLGICGGLQSLNVALGGSMFQDIKEQLGTTIDHSSPAAITQEGNKHLHPIQVVQPSLLRTIVRRPVYNVNTFHHQAIKLLGKKLMVSAKAGDDIIEAIEHVALPFCLGIQWHPEFSSCKEDRMLFKAFVEAAKKYTRQN